MDCASENLVSSSSSSSDTNPDTPRASSSSLHPALNFVQSHDPELRLQGAREIRHLTKTSHRCRRQLASAVKPLVQMLFDHSPDSHRESALLALLNLAVKDEK